MRPDLSLIVPCHNEAENLEELQAEIAAALKDKFVYEVIYVDDGSSDKSFEVLKKLAKKDKRVKVIRFLRNFGQTAAMAAGIEKASGKLFVTMDADRQNNPEDINKLIAELKEDVDIVSGWRKKRKDAWTRVLLSNIANLIINRLTGTKLHDTGCSLKIYRRKCFKGLRLYGEMHRFIPALLVQQGFKAKEVVVNHRPRVKGKTHYGFSRISKVILDLITIRYMARFSNKPIHVFGAGGILILVLGFLSGGFVIYRKIWLGGEWVSPLLFIAVLLITIGWQFIMMGLLAEMITLANFESTGKKPYRVKSELNF
jgi:glycosyltransferase involved in cell wall biosynthesis